MVDDLLIGAGLVAILVAVALINPIAALIVAGAIATAAGVIGVGGER